MLSAFIWAAARVIAAAALAAHGLVAAGGDGARGRRPVAAALVGPVAAARVLIVAAISATAATAVAATDLSLLDEEDPDAEHLARAVHHRRGADVGVPVLAPALELHVDVALANGDGRGDVARCPPPSPPDGLNVRRVSIGE